MKKFKKGDIVLITSGKDKGKTGEIVKIIPKTDKIIVKGINLYKKHVKPTQNQEGGIIARERPLSTGKISLMQDGKAIRINQRKKI
ncbi:MAG: 50S ribosomal protein L24 [uncultured bacterium]|nr:MAG: 50S ribosomal protein L24 [uncultured bacterium]KKU15127.1 MAG: 50S ribosomal protein L24 [Microgenomates group bacterium GW2011_GWC2_45_8]KKU26333.1 MAG: 50S ribosomal protein L24 [Microgenomates group bacterium GW2011_GWA2_46_16]